MTAFEKILHFLEGEMTRPGNYGWFHLMFMGIAIAVTVFLCLKFKDCDTKTVNRILLISWIVMVVGEVLKQTLFSFNFDGTTVEWHYQWYAFPYQLCGTPLLVMPAIFLSKEGKFRDACLAFMATFSLFGGLAVYFYPNDVFVSEIAINLQTMIHHGIQVVVGIFLVVHNRKKLTLKYYFGSVAVFAALVALAIAMNISIYHIFKARGIDETFNMFFISPYFPCTLPVLSIFYPMVPYPVFLAIYIFGFMIVCAIMHFGAKGIVALTMLGKKENTDKAETPVVEAEVNEESKTPSGT